MLFFHAPPLIAPAPCAPPPPCPPLLISMSSLIAVGLAMAVMKKKIYCWWREGYEQTAVIMLFVILLFLAFLDFS